MSLVAYGSSDESSDDDRNNHNVENKNKVTSQVIIEQTNDKLCLPSPKHEILIKNCNKSYLSPEITKTNECLEKIQFNKLPKPRGLITEIHNIVEEDDLPLKKKIELKSEKPMKRDRAPVKITVPSLSEFKDVEKETESKTSKIRPSNKGTKLFALLPPPKATEVKTTNKLVPSIVNKVITKGNNEVNVPPAKNTNQEDSEIKKTIKLVIKDSASVSYDTNSEEEDDVTINSHNNSTTDFFALTATDTVLDSDMLDSINANTDLTNFNAKVKNDCNKGSSSFIDLAEKSEITIKEISIDSSQKTLVSNVINLPKEEILLKNKAEVGPKLPVPEQEYNVDTEGNVAFDEKAIEYLCGRRGVKRKSKEIEEANVIEINGEDIKPDEREWLVKALTEEPVQRPISMQGGGVSSQSKKKHQITYLAHQAKAMEMELKNQWAQNRLTRKQTQSKYGF